VSRVSGALAVALGAASCATLLAGAWYATQAREHAQLRLEAMQRLADLRQQRIDVLERELAAALAAGDGMRAVVKDRLAAEVAVQKQREERLLAATRPLPEGLRLAVSTLHDLLRRSGHGDLRVLSARAIADKQMRGVELFAPPTDAALGATLWQAERLGFHLDRKRGALTLRFHEGRVVRDGVAQPLPEGGEPLVLFDVDGPAFEERLPYLVVAEGEYPKPQPVTPPRARLDPFTEQSWRERLNRLLAAADTPCRYRVTELGGLADGRFLGVVLLASTDGNRLEQVVEVDRLAVRIDETAGTVDLELVGGVFHRAGGDTDLPRDEPGQLILLPGVTPKEASLFLTGMVLRR